MAQDIKTLAIEEFTKFENRLNGQKDNRVHQIRRDALETFKNLSLPTKKDEDWKYTNVSFVGERQFSASGDKPDENLSRKDIEPFIIKDLQENLLVFVNGVYSDKLSSIKYPREEIIIENFASAEKRKSPNLNKHFATLANYKNNFFTALNTALATDGMYVNVPSGVIINEPIHAMFISDTRKGPVFSAPRDLVLIGKCSQLKIVGTYHTIGDNPAFINMASEIFTNFSSRLEFTKIQNDKGNTYYIGSTHANQRRNSALDVSTISLSGKFIRNEIYAKLAEENAETNLSGLYYMTDENFIDNFTIIDHSAPSCESSEFYKGIMEDKSKGVFNGKIVVQKDAQNTNSHQKNKNILLNDAAKIHTKPQLEIYADDVKCSHGATTGYLDKEALFYMRSRGLSEKVAKSLLLNSFASDIIETIKIAEIRDDIKRQVAERLSVDDIYFCESLDELVENEKESEKEKPIERNNCNE